MTVVTPLPSPNMRGVSVVLAIILALAFCSVGDAFVLKSKSDLQSVPTVPALNLTQYLGLWYQVYQDLLDSVAGETNALCATATYGVNPNGTVSVFNQERVGNVHGSVSSILGYAFYKDASIPGQLTVVFPPPVPFPAPYWVLALGPVIDDVYQYAVVSDPNQFSLYVLARNPQLFAAKWDADVRAQLNAWGFNQFWNEPKPMIQDGCPPF